MIAKHTKRRPHAKHSDRPKHRHVGNRLANPNRDTRAFDLRIGGRVRLARIMRGMSQTEIADALGLTFQQIQKYENGTNRIVAGRLYRMSLIFKVPVGYFFASMEKQPILPPAGAFDPITDRVTLNIMRALAGITDRHKRRTILAITRAVAGSDRAAAE